MTIVASLSEAKITLCVIMVLEARLVTDDSRLRNPFRAAATLSSAFSEVLSQNSVVYDFE